MGKIAGWTYNDRYRESPGSIPLDYWTFVDGTKIHSGGNYDDELFLFQHTNEYGEPIYQSPMFKKEANVRKAAVDYMRRYPSPKEILDELVASGFILPNQKRLGLQELLSRGIVDEQTYSEVIQDLG